MELALMTRDWYTNVMSYKADSRTSSWFLMPTPWPTCFLVISYLVFVQVAPSYMAKRDPFPLNTVLIFYNFGLVVLSSFILYELSITTLFNPHFDNFCQNVDYSTDAMAVRLASAIWWYFISKVIELLDTVFFVLRKKNNQVTFLHVYHHSTMVLLWWTGTKFVAGGESFFSPMINCFIHVLMYTYYLLAACGQRMRKYLWWKKYMTKLQLIQFAVIVCRTAHVLYVDCGFPPSYLYALIAYMASHIVLFTNFYRKTYVTRQHNHAHRYHDNSIQNGHSSADAVSKKAE